MRPASYYGDGRTSITIYEDYLPVSLTAHEELGELDLYPASRTILPGFQNGCTDILRTLGIRVPNLASLYFSIVFNREIEEKDVDCDVVSAIIISLFFVSTYNKMEN